MFVVDSGSGLNKALNEKYRVDEKQIRRAIRIRCHVHRVPIRAQTRRVKCISVDNTFESISLGQMMAA
jgi:ferric-dicitrate binding protein FerR (iron transport regulator)